MPQYFANPRMGLRLGRPTMLCEEIYVILFAEFKAWVIMPSGLLLGVHNAKTSFVQQLCF